MKKILLYLSLIFLLSSCSSYDRELYYEFTFDGYSITPGYDDVEFMHLVFDVDMPETLSAYEIIEDKPFYLWNKYIGDVDFFNDSNSDIAGNEAKVSGIDIFLSNIDGKVYKLNGRQLKKSVKQNCDMLNGQYLERNGYACTLGKMVGNKRNIVILSGDILNIDQDELSRIEIYVE